MSGIDDGGSEVE